MLWADASGRTLIIVPRPGRPAAPLTGILHGGRFTPLPGPPVQTSNVAW